MSTIEIVHIYLVLLIFYIRVGWTKHILLDSSIVLVLLNFDYEQGLRVKNLRTTNYLLQPIGLYLPTNNKLCFAEIQKEHAFLLVGKGKSSWVKGTQPIPTQQKQFHKNMLL